jgi:ketosteroid isomerase-like protein
MPLQLLRFIPVLVLCTGVAGAQTRTLASADSLWAHNYQVHDTATALQLMSEDFFMTTSQGRTKTRADELADIRPSAGLRMRYFRTEGSRLREYGETGVVIGIASWSFDMNGRESSIRRRYTAVYRRGGPLGWQLVALHMGVAPPQ